METSPVSDSLRRAPFTVVTPQDGLKHRFSGVYRRILQGKVSGDEIEAFARECDASGVIKLTLDPELLDEVVLPNNLHKPGAIDPAHLPRYGQEDRPIHSFLFCGKAGQPGAAYIYSNGDRSDSDAYPAFNGPPHLHEQESHLSLIMQGHGLYFVLAETPIGARFVTVSVCRGDLLVIPLGRIHTFWAPGNRPFGVLSMTSQYVPSNTPAFQRYLSRQELALLPPRMDFEEYLALCGSALPA